MELTPDPLVLDLVEWIAVRPRPYAEVMEAWRSSCPRLTIWEDALDGGYVRLSARPDRGLLVVVTEAGHRMLKHAGRVPACG